MIEKVKIPLLPRTNELKGEDLTIDKRVNIKGVIFVRPMAKKKKREIVPLLLLSFVLSVIAGGGFFLFSMLTSSPPQKVIAAEQTIKEKKVKKNPKKQPKNEEKTIILNIPPPPLTVHSIGAEMVDYARLDMEVPTVENNVHAPSNEELNVPGNSIDQKVPTEEEKLVELNQKTIEPYQMFIEQASKEFHVEQSWITAVIEKESKFDPQAVNVNSDGTLDRGLMQINSGTVKEITTKLGLTYVEGMEFDPFINIRMGTFYLSEIQKKNPDVHYLFTAYNRGPTGAEKWFLDKGTYATEYSQSVIEKIKKYDGFMVRL